MLLVLVEIGVVAASGVALPLASNRVLGPATREDFANVDSVVVGFPVFKPHPPVAIQFERVVQSLLKPFVVVPRLIFVSEGAGPHAVALAPGVAHVHELQSLHIGQVSHLEHAVGFVVLNAFDSVTVYWLAVIFDRVLANHDEALLM